MKTSAIALAAGAVAALATPSTSATSAKDAVFTFGTPTFLGSGCPKDSVAIIPATDNQSFSVLFSEFAATTGPSVSRDRKSCNLAVPVTVKSGVSIGIFRVDYRGNAYVPKSPSAYAQFDVEYYFAGQRGPTATKKYTPGFNDDILITNQIEVGAIVWSPCGAATNFRINSAVTAFKNVTRDGDEVQIAIDSVDTTVEKGFRYYLTTKKC